jgi:hypothetical protein
MNFQPNMQMMAHQQGMGMQVPGAPSAQQPGMQQQQVQFSILFQKFAEEQLQNQQRQTWQGNLSPKERIQTIQEFISSARLAKQLPENQVIIQFAMNSERSRCYMAATNKVGATDA